MGRKGSEHVQSNYNFEQYKQKWVELMDSVHEKYGSWENRKGYQPWEMKEVS